jgi:hypothetical protein
MRDRLDDLRLSYAVLPRESQMRAQLVGAVHGDQSADRHEAAVLFRKTWSLPDITEQDIVREFRKLGSDVISSVA